MFKTNYETISEHVIRISEQYQAGTAHKLIREAVKAACLSGYQTPDEIYDELTARMYIANDRRADIAMRNPKYEMMLRMDNEIKYLAVAQLEAAQYI